jgi:hypothetical protein
LLMSSLMTNGRDGNPSVTQTHTSPEGRGRRATAVNPGG